MPPRSKPTVPAVSRGSLQPSQQPFPSVVTHPTDSGPTGNPSTHMRSLQCSWRPTVHLRGELQIYSCMQPVFQKPPQIYMPLEPHDPQQATTPNLQLSPQISPPNPVSFSRRLKGPHYRSSHEPVGISPLIYELSTLISYH